MSRFFMALTLVWAALTFTVQAQGYYSSTISYQGFLALDEQPVTSDSAPLGACLYTHQYVGSPIFCEDHQGTPIVDGYFTLVLGTNEMGTPLPSFDPDTDYFIEVSYNDEKLPRVPLTAVPIALSAGQVAWEDVTGKPGNLGGGGVASSAKEGCRAYVIPYMPYGPTASQVIYLSHLQDDPNVITFSGARVHARVADDKGNTFDLGEIATMNPNQVVKLAPFLDQALRSAGFMGSKAIIRLELRVNGSVTRGSDVFAFAGYNVGGGDRATVEVECLL
jgi:hypothetical protein